MRIGLEGVARSALSAGIPIRLGGMSAGATGRSALALDYYLDADRGASFAASAARHLGSLPDPYDLGQVAAAFEDGRLLGLTLEARGELELGGSLLVGASFSIAAGSGASMGLSLGIRVKRSGHFALSVVPVFGERAGEILVEIEELRSHAQAGSAGLGVSLDSFGSLAERLLEHFVGRSRPPSG